MTEFHADDYGLFPAQSGRILDCWREGALNGTSLMPNSPCLDECLDMLPPEGIALTVHLNLIEGRCLAPKEALPLLVDDRGVFRVSFSSLLFSRFTGKYREYRREIKMELSAQIRALRSVIEGRGEALRLDGHAHWHMLPVVFDALMDVIAEEELPVAYIRIPREPIGLFLRHFPAILPFHPINIVKSLLLPEAEAEAARRGWGVELLAHPGAVYEEADIRELTSRDDLAFLTSPDRMTEAEALCRIGRKEAVNV